MDTHHGKTLGKLIRAAREAKGAAEGLNQGGCAFRLGVTAQYLSAIESDDKTPSLGVLLKFYDVLVPDKHPAILAAWLNKWLAATTDRIAAATAVAPATADERKFIPSEARERIHEALRCAQGGLRFLSPDWKGAGARSLKDFPEAFYPLTVVCGDRRESSPLNRGDIYASSVSSVDVDYLPRLGLRPDTRILTDKLFVVKEVEYLREKFSETNLLVVGSPAVNFLARTINNGSIFRFDFTQEAKDFDRELRLLKELNSRDTLRVFWQMAQKPSDINIEDYGDSGMPSEQRRRLAETVRRLTRGRTPEQITDMYRKLGIVDTAHGILRAHEMDLDTDYGLVSLARNPFAATSEYACIFVAGVHGPGTSKGLKALAAPDNFERHPLGGVLQVDLDVMEPWPDRVEKARWRWVQPRGYTLERLLVNLSDKLHGKRPADAFANWTEDEARDCVNFIKDVTGQKGGAEPHRAADAG